MIELLTGFIAELRRAGLPVSLSEDLDAAQALGYVGLENRQALKCALGATLVKSSGHWRVFETIFDVYFTPSGPQLDLVGDADHSAARGDEGLAIPEEDGTGLSSVLDMSSDGQLMEILRRALTDGDEAMLVALARQAVALHAGMEPGRPVGAAYYLYRTLRHLHLDAVLADLMDAAHTQAEGGLTSLQDRLARDEYQARIDSLRQEVEAEIRRRLVLDRGAEAVARSLRKPLPEDVSFMHATREELAELGRAVHPLTRRLAVHLARRRRQGHQGSVDVRNTVRHSLSYGGVPVDLKFRHPRPAKPEIVVIADISGSVAAFARFTLQLVYAISAQFSKVRSFVFIDEVDEVTRFFEEAETFDEAVRRVNTEADVVWADGHSDYGHALEALWGRWGHELSTRSSVLVLGDARNNYHAANAWVLAEISRRVRHLYWLNPEPRSYWDTGDSIVSQYALHCEATVECRNLRQLEAFIEHLA